MKTTERMISVGELTPCPWNPRGEITPESVADLTASIKARGLLQNIGVWKRPDADGYYVIFGNRRFVACVNAMMPEIRCRVFECSEVEAHEITRIENEARLGVSPIEDAKLIGKMLDMGYSGKEIAAHFAISEACVTRRRKLLDLSPAWIGRAAEVEIPADALEGVSAYPVQIQDRVLSRVTNWALREGWSCLRSFFYEATQDLDSGYDFAAFDSELLERCRKCPKRTGAQPDLFGDVDGKLGRCLDGKCFKATKAAWRKKIIDDVVPPEVTERHELGPYDNINDKCYTDKPTRGKPAAYYKIEIRRDKVTVRVRYGAGKAEKKAAEKMREAKERKEEERQRAREKLVASAKAKVAAWANKTDPGAVAVSWAMTNGAVDPWRLLQVYIVSRIGNLDLKKLVAQGAKYFITAFWDINQALRNKKMWASDILRLSSIMPGMLDDLTNEERKALEEQVYY